MRILIVSTPKTGNTWVKDLLASIYELPIVNVGPTFDAAEADQLGEQWIAHQHYVPHAALLDWAERNDVLFVTTIRHPCDVLVSLFHYMKNFEFPAGHPPTVMQKDGDRMGQHTASYLFAPNGFDPHLDISLKWMRSNRTHVIRYEDLQRDPVAALRSLTDKIRAVDVDRIERAIESCHIDQMRGRAGKDARFYREGKVGGWRSVVPRQILEIFRSRQPFPAQLAALGYSLD